MGGLGRGTGPTQFKPFSSCPLSPPSLEGKSDYWQNPIRLAIFSDSLLIGNERAVSIFFWLNCLFFNEFWSLISKINPVSQILEDSKYISKLPVLKSTLQMLVFSLSLSAFQLTILLPSDTISESWHMSKVIFFLPKTVSSWSVFRGNKSVVEGEQLVAISLKFFNQKIPGFISFGCFLGHDCLGWLFKYLFQTFH